MALGGSKNLWNRNDGDACVYRLGEYICVTQLTVTPGSWRHLLARGKQPSQRLGVIKTREHVCRYGIGRSHSKWHVACHDDLVFPAADEEGLACKCDHLCMSPPGPVEGCLVPPGTVALGGKVYSAVGILLSCFFF